MKIERAGAEVFDRQDPLAAYASRFLPLDRGAVYLDGHSLGRPTARALARVNQLIGVDWSGDLVRAWDHWADLPFGVGDRIAALLGAHPGEVVVGDSTSVQLYKVVCAVVRAAGVTDPVLAVTAGEFPTDRYVVQGIADAVGGRVELLDVVSGEGVDPERLDAFLERTGAATAVLAAVDFRSGARTDIRACNEVAARRGTTIVWDLSHAAGVVPVALGADGVEAAVGCTYKYLHGGPGSPAFAYVRSDRQQAWRQPIWGWWGQRDQFAMGADYAPDDRMHQYAVGTPPVVQLALVDEGVAVVAAAGIEAIDQKRSLLTGFAIDLIEDRLDWLGARIETPRQSARRGGHVCVVHSEASRLCLAARDRGVVTDVRPPDRLRLGLAPLTTSFVDVWDAIDVFTRLLASGAHLRYPLDVHHA